MQQITKKALIAPLLTLFTSSGTLICCALPALMVSIGAGAALAGLVSAVPQLIWLSQHKVLVFSVAGVMLLISGILQWQNRNAPCPIDPQQAKTCTKLRWVSVWIYWVSVAIYAVGFFFAFFAAKIFFPS